MPIRQELRPMLALAIPIILADLGWNLMSVVDTMMVGRITPGAATAIGAVSIGSIFFYTVAMLGGGLMLGLDTLVSHAYGACNREECHRALLSGLYLAGAVLPPLMGALWLFPPFFRLFGYEPGLQHEIARFLHALVWSMPPLFVYMVFRRYLQAVNRARPVMFTLITANLVNLAGNWILIYGHLGAPALGTAGSAWSTVAARVYMAAVLAGYAFYDERPRLSLRPDIVRIRKLAALGLPAACQITIEIGVFATAGALVGKLGAVPLAAHQITMHTISATFMVTLGLGSAAAVRVGHALGRKDARAAAVSGWTAIVLGVVFMASCGLVLLGAPRSIARVFTADAAVIDRAVALLAVGAGFQIFDGLQSCVMGALRGAGDTRTPMLCHLAGHWGIGLPAGYAFCFLLGWNVIGMWVGLSVSVMLIASVLVCIWARRVQSLL